MRRKKARFLELYGRSFGVIADLCRRVGISRETFYEWRKNDPAFAQALEDKLETLNDQVEEKLFKLIFEDNNPAAVRYYLDRRHPAYNPRIKVEHQADTKTLEDLLYESAERRKEEAERNQTNLTV